MARGVRHARWTIALTSVAALVACAHPPELPLAPPAELAPGLESRVGDVELADLVEASPDTADVEQLLEDAGFVGGRERVFAGGAGPVRTIVARVLRFGSPDGADAYLAWVRANGTGLVGGGDAVDPLDAPGSPLLFIHTPGACCGGKDVARALAVWRRGDAVLWVEARGPGVSRSLMTRLAESMDAALEAADPD